MKSFLGKEKHIRFVATWRRPDIRLGSRREGRMNEKEKGSVGLAQRKGQILPKGAQGLPAP
jgi:hypothetical protein